jgi:hypothetical protein
MGVICIFRCRTCGRVADEGAWPKKRQGSESAPSVLLAYPLPVCPACRSEDIDLDHGWKEGPAIPIQPAE